MKKFTKAKSLFGFLILFFVLSYQMISAQTFCTNNNGTLSPAITNSWNTLTVTGGFYEFQATSGCDYTFTYCSNGGSSSLDPYLTITDLFDVASDWNDDFCGLSSELTWTCTTTGTYRIHFGECCGGTSLCSFSASTIAYYSTCSSCPGIPPVSPIVTSDSGCGPSTLSFTADQNGALNCITVWFQQGNSISLDTTYTALSNFDVTISSSTNYYAINVDNISGCSSSPALITGTINSLPSISVTDISSIICLSNAPVTPTYFPTGGSLSGNGISSGNFDPMLAGLGTHNIYYDYTNPSTGCQNIDTFTIEVENPTIDPAIYVCDGSSVTLTGSGLTSYDWFDESIGGNNIGNGMSITVTNIIGDSTFYYTENSYGDGFMIDTLLSDNFSFVDHDFITSDDHGGIAITENYIFYTGDGSGVRYDFPSLTNPIAVTIRDGIFSNLSNGTLWSLWNGVVDPVGTSIATGGYTFNSIIELNQDLTLGTNIIPLSQTISTGGNYGGPQSGIFAGHGFMIFHNNDDNNFYHINLNSGLVTVLSNMIFPSNAGSTENWARWGVAEYYNGVYSVVYSTAYTNNSIDRVYCISGLTETVAQFTNLGDVASIVYSPWANKWAYHTEANTDHCSGGEVIVQLDGTHLLSMPNLMCRKEITVMVSPSPIIVDAGSDVTINNGSSTSLNGTGGVSGTWSPVTGLDNPNVLNPNASPSVTTVYYLTATDIYGCVGIDSVTVTVSTVGLAENSIGNNILVYPNPSKGDVTIDFSKMNNFINAKIDVIDSYGKVISSILGADNNQVILKKAELSNGVYTLNILIDGETFIKRLVLID